MFNSLFNPFDFILGMQEVEPEERLGFALSQFPKFLVTVLLILLIVLALWLIL